MTGRSPSSSGALWCSGPSGKPPGDTSLLGDGSGVGSVDWRARLRRAGACRCWGGGAFPMDATMTTGGAFDASAMADATGAGQLRAPRAPGKRSLHHQAKGRLYGHDGMMRGSLIAVALTLGLARADPRTAFALVGPATHVTRESLERYRRFVVDAFGGVGETFVLLKALDAEGRPWAHDAVATLRRDVAQTLKPVVADVNASDAAFARFQGSRAAIAARLWPDDALMYRGRGRRQTEDRIAYWWGALDLAWRAVAAREAVASKRFDFVVVARSDLLFHGPLRHVSTADPRYWYSAPDPPDAFWIFARDVAAEVLPTVSRLERCGGGNSTCDDFCDAAAGFVFLMFSWFLPCFWTARFYDDRGLRLVIDPTIRASWRHAVGPPRDVAQCASKIVCASAAPGAYDARVHPRPAADFACGPWRSTRCDGRPHGGDRRLCETRDACRATAFSGCGVAPWRCGSSSSRR